MKSSSDISHFIKVSRKIQAEAAQHRYFQSDAERRHKKELSKKRFRKRMKKKAKGKLSYKLVP